MLHLSGSPPNNPEHGKKDTHTTQNESYGSSGQGEKWIQIIRHKGSFHLQAARFQQFCSQWNWSTVREWELVLGCPAGLSKWIITPYIVCNNYNKHGCRLQVL